MAAFGIITINYSGILLVLKEVFEIVDIMDKLQQIATIVKSPDENQKIINVSDVFYIWDILVTKLDILETILLLENFIDHFDLKIIKNKVKEGITTGITDMEKLMAQFGIPFPDRPPAGINTTTNIEQFTEKYVFQALYEGIQAFFFVLASGFMNSNNPIVRKAMKNHLLLTMELHEMLVEYGKLKAFLNEPPVYRP